MRISSRLFRTALLAALLIGSSAGTASARNLSFSSQNMRATWAEFEFEVSAFNIRCPITLEGSFHARTIAKIANALIGAITRAIFKEESCAGGGSAHAKNLPWHLTYEAFTGTLPNITNVIFLVSRFRYELISPECTAEYGETTDNISLRGSREVAGSLTGLEVVSNRNVSRRIGMGFGFCSGIVRLIGPEGSITNLAGTISFNVRLI